MCVCVFVRARVRVGVRACVCWLADRLANRQAGRQTDRQAETGRQAGRRVERPHAGERRQAGWAATHILSTGPVARMVASMSRFYSTCTMWLRSSSVCTGRSICSCVCRLYVVMRARSPDASCCSCSAWRLLRARTSAVSVYLSDIVSKRTNLWRAGISASFRGGWVDAQLCVRLRAPRPIPEESGEGEEADEEC